MNNILINGTSIRNLGWYVKTKTISKPEIKANYAEIPGRNGSLDLTELFGSIPYGDRSVEIELICLDYDNAQDLMLTLAAYVHGKSITLTEVEPNKINAQTSYTARLAISDHGYDGRAYTAKLSGIASPQAHYCRNVMQNKELSLTTSAHATSFNLAWTSGVNMVVSTGGGQSGIRMNINGSTIDVTDGVPVSLSNDQYVGQALVVGANTIYYTGITPAPSGGVPDTVTVTIGEGVDTYN